LGRRLTIKIDGRSQDGKLAVEAINQNFEESKLPIIEIALFK